MKSAKKYYVILILVSIIFLLPLVVSSVSIAANIKASLSVSELLGFTQESYDMLDSYELDGTDVIDRFVNNDIPSDFYEEQERAILRDHQYPKPFGFYLSFFIFVAYIVIYVFIGKDIRPKMLKITPMLITFIICVYFVVTYSENYMLLIETYQYYLDNIF